MSDVDEFEPTTEGMKNLRKAYEKAVSERDAALTEVTSLRGTVRTRTISDKLTELGVNSKVARFIPADVELEKLDVWLGENADVFGISLAPKDDAANSAEAAAQARSAQLEGSLPGGDAAEAKNVAAMSIDDLKAAIWNAQAG